MRLELLLDMAAQACGERIAVGNRITGPTMSQLRDLSARVATHLGAAGSNRLVLASVSSDACPALLFGAGMAGAVFTGVNYRLSDDRLRAVVARTVPAVVVVDEETRERLTGIEGAVLVSADDLLAPTAANLEAGADQDPMGEDVAISLFTSGTTGDPKVVLLRHRNLFSYVTSTIELGSAGADEAALVSVPPYHIAGLAAILSNVYLGRRIVYLPQFEAAEWLRVAAEERITHAMIVPTMLSRILEVLERERVDLPHLRHLSYGGGRMPLTVIERAMTRLPAVDFVNAYGLTETSSTITVLTPDDHRQAASSRDEAVRSRLGSVGRALPGVEIEIRDVDGVIVEPGEIGELFVRGDQVSGEYAERTAVTETGWFATKDLARSDRDGFIFLEGRADDIIVRGGENLSPGEIEDVLLEHPAVTDVAVVGIPDTEWGEVPAAAVVVDEHSSVTVAELQEWVLRRLRSSRTPQSLMMCSGLPYSDTGKLLRRVVRDNLLAAYGDVDERTGAT